MVQLGVALDSQLHTRKVPIPRFRADEISPAQWIATGLQLKAAMTSQGCKEAWSATPHATDTKHFCDTISNLTKKSSKRFDDDY